MMKPRATLLAALAAVVVLGVAGCAPAAAPDEDGPVTITVTGKPPADQPEQLKVFNDRIDAFMADHPDITVEGSDKNFDPQTFNAMLAGGTLPDLYVVYFTDSLSIVRNKQAGDITEALTSTGILNQLNPTTLELASDDDGNVYGVPFTAYALGLVYNRDLFTQAGLDPDKPPTTWDELRDYAKQITEATGVPGYGTMTQTNTGGWMLTAATYSYGGTMENEDGTEATFDDGPTAEYLTLLSEMRFDDKSIGDNILYDQAGIGEALASNRVGMFIGSPSSYHDATVTYGMNPESIGMGPMPQANGTNGSLTGGGVFMVSPDTTEAQKEALALYVKEVYLDAKLIEKSAVDAAKANADQNLPVGLPELQVLSDSSYETYLGWISEYINVPLSNFDPYTASLTTMPLLIEPPVKAQDVYASLDPVIQAVLADPHADIDALIASAITTVNGKIAR
ncbi:extracellular solute-binding protein [uncultured Schumannella sp.]|uniref:extracellular solute-binding protein n=1 Tax=uncultured Schumannella sp. TaxID=1195956 RepID=UPI0025F591AA|nr:extracellular solute-binding protein [uncultured Schumannella sp.]